MEVSVSRYGYPEIPEKVLDKNMFSLQTGKRETGNGKRETGNGKRETGNGKRETGNGKRETGRGWEAGMQYKYKILLVDDDNELLKMLRSYLEIKGYTVYTALDGMEALDKLKCDPDIILLDVNMPKMDGLEVCRRIRDMISCPIIFLTARAEEQDKVNGLLSGGDDYVLKPFSLKELEARIVSHLKREERHKTQSQYRFKDGMIIDYTKRSVVLDGQKIELTKTEYEIIEFLSTNPGQIFDKERIYERVCGYQGEGDSRGITELIRRIRKKFLQYSLEEYIETVWGMGYKWKQ